uniref:Aminotransferase class V domain-containing protein n=1 Tax=Panagrolaimus sp. JU765 TaxID=591449 RepID=A0AC34QM38_9BILA
MEIPEDYIYLDHNATTPMRPETIAEIQKALHVHGNPSSSHLLGQKSKELLKGYRKMVGDAFNVEPEFVVFTSGGTETNNTVIRLSVDRFLELGNNMKPVVFTSKMEHPSILNCLENLATNDIIEVKYFPINENGIVEYQNISNELLPRTALVTIMFANNETGVIQPVNDIFDHFKRKAIENGVTFQPIFHTDASQIIGRVPLPTPFAFDLMTVTGHKFGGPCSGALIATNNETIKALKRHPLFFGGGQEFGIRSGTENLPMIAGLAAAIKAAVENVADFDFVQELRNYFEKELEEKFNAKSFFETSPRLPNTASIVFPDLKITASELLEKCNTVFAASTGAACHANTVMASPCLVACGRTTEEAIRTVRFSLGQENTKSQIDKVVTTLNEQFSSLKT